MLEWVGSKEEVMVERGHVNFCWSLWSLFLNNIFVLDNTKR